MSTILILSLLPIVLILLLVIIFRRSLFFSAPITFALTLGLSLFVWQITYTAAWASSLKGLFIAVEITIIVFGAIFFLEIMKRKGIIESIEYHLSRLSADKRVQVILLAWFFVSFLEGAAGFGTPAAIVAPLLVALGFPAVTAVAVALIGDSTAVAFGAVGTPIRLGFAGLDTSGVGFYAGIVGLVAGTFVPLMMVAVVVYLSDKKWQHVKEMIPFSLLAGLCFTVPYFLLSIFDAEFPSLLGSLIGLALMVFFIKKKTFLPKKLLFDKKLKIKANYSMMRSFSPYIVVVLLLLCAKFFPWRNYTHTIQQGIVHTFNLINPGLIFIFVAVAFSSGYVVCSLKKSFFKLEKAFLTLFFIAAFVQLMAHTDFNLSGLASMVGVMSQFAQTSALPFIAPFVGALGAFIAGSATVSNLLFGKVQASSATLLGIPANKILALQVSGAGAGNMVALNNIVAAQATVKLHGKESKILRINIIPCLIYLVIAGLVGLAFVLI